MEEDEASAKSFEFGLPYINLDKFPVDLNALGLFTDQQSKETNAVIFYREGNDLRVGTTDPNSPLLRQYLDKLHAQHGYKATIYFISNSSLLQTQQLFGKVVRAPERHEENVEVKPETDYSAALKELETATALSATELISIILGAAEKYKASDIHLEPEEKFIKLRFRLDGVLSDVAHLASSYQKTIISRIKILSKMKLNVETQPQDGRFTFILRGQPTDVRVSVLPGAYGEGVVMRILNAAEAGLQFEDLGFVGRSLELIRNELQKPNGMILTTGPTGSGKTTTLYAFLNLLNEPGVKIITLEDPIEYKLEGINQTPVNGNTGMTFASGLRAILRQDPDVIMVGEIRDQETAETALQAALTGHVVLSTLHTNDAAGAIPRLRNMGVAAYVIAPALNAIIAQRLVRRLCPDCKKEQKLDPFVLQRVKQVLDSIPAAAKAEVPKELKFFHSEGCDKCNHTGYRGRIGIYEVIVRNDKLEKLIMSDASSMDIKKAAVEDGMLTMTQDGLLKALQGVTDVEEVFRVTQD